MDMVKVVVTGELIARGERQSPLACPIALGLEAAGKIDPDVDDGYARWTDPGTLARMRAELPGEALEFIERFDDGDPVEPAEFELAPDYDSFEEDD